MKIIKFFPIVIFLFVLYGCSDDNPPIAKITDVQLMNNLVTFNLGLMDKDDVLTDYLINIETNHIIINQLTEEDGIKTNDANKNIQFTDLTQNTKYRISIIGNYRLGEKEYDHQILDTYEFRTGYFGPTGRIKNSILENDRITVSVNTLRNISSLIELSLRVKQDENIISEKILTEENSEISFCKLKQNTHYHMSLIADYKINDLLYSQQVLDEYDFTTSTWDPLPNGVIKNTQLIDDTILFDASITDFYDVITELSINLMQGDTILSKLTSLQTDVINNNLTFSGLVEDTTYSISIVADYEDELTIYQVMLDRYEFTTDTGYFAEKEVLNSNIIAHAGGALDGNTLLNSVENLEYNYDHGLRIFEIDFAFTSDGELVGTHYWEESLFGSNWSYNNRPTLAEYDNIKIKGIYTGLSFKRLLSIMEEYPDMYIVLDTKEVNTMKVYQKIVEDTIAYNYTLLNRIIPQLYFISQYEETEEIYGFSQYIFTLYRTKETPNDVIYQFLEEHPKIIILSVDMGKINDFSNEEIDKIKNDLKRRIFVHTVNSIHRIDIYHKRGIDGFYSDFITQDTYNENYKALQFEVLS